MKDYKYKYNKGIDYLIDILVIILVVAAFGFTVVVLKNIFYPSAPVILINDSIGKMAGII